MKVLNPIRAINAISTIVLGSTLANGKVPAATWYAGVATNPVMTLASSYRILAFIL
jgi:hypothetical protein